MKDFSGPEGGKSGEFFLVSTDRRMIMKTMKESELNVLLSKLKNYIKYLNDNQDSLISKIYGIYTLERKGVANTKVHVLMMRNIAGCSREYIEATYDLKGSSY